MNLLHKMLSEEGASKSPQLDKLARRLAKMANSTMFDADINPDQPMASFKFGHARIEVRYEGSFECDGQSFHDETSAAAYIIGDLLTKYYE